MDIAHKPAIDMDPLLCTPIFSAIMSRNSFQLLLKFLHFNNNSNMPAPIDTLFKLWPLLDHVSACNISIDESLLLWKGRLGFKEYILLKELDLVWNNLCCVSTGKENIAPRAQERSLSWESCLWPHTTKAAERTSFVHWQPVYKLANVQVPSQPRNFSLWNNPKQQEGIPRATKECTIEKRQANSLSLWWAIGNKIER